MLKMNVKRKYGSRFGSGQICCMSEAGVGGMGGSGYSGLATQVCAGVVGPIDVWKRTGGGNVEVKEAENYDSISQRSLCCASNCQSIRTTCRGKISGKCAEQATQEKKNSTTQVVARGRGGVRGGDKSNIKRNETPNARAGGPRIAPQSRLGGGGGDILLNPRGCVREEGDTHPPPPLMTHR